MHIHSACTSHPLTAEKCVHQFRYFLQLMRTPNPHIVCSCIYSFVLKWALMCTLAAGGVRIGAHFNSNAYVHEETTIWFGVRISSRKYLNWCTPFSAVSQWYTLVRKCGVLTRPWNCFVIREWSLFMCFCKGGEVFIKDISLLVQTKVFLWN